MRVSGGWNRAVQDSDFSETVRPQKAPKEENVMRESGGEVKFFPETGDGG